MDDNIPYRPRRKSFRRSNKWIKLFFIGFVTYIIGLIVIVFTGNPNLFPSLVLLGNFLIPVTYVAFFYERRKLSNVNLSNTAASFFYGGFLGTFFAAFFEPIFIHSLDPGTAIVVGFIEEFAKILGVLIIVRKKKYDLALDGVILGAAAGMGFAALESSGYAFTAFLRSQGSLSVTVFITLLRGILSPLGHGTWTAILAGILLKSREKKGLLSMNAIGAYLLVVFLHGLWDGIPTIIAFFIPSEAAGLLGELLVGLAGIVILYRVYKYSLKEARLRLEQ